jgi:hypothetical protein
MPDGFEVNADTVVSCGKQISEMGSKAEQLKSDCEGAQVPNIAWGLLGAATTFSSYQDLLEKFKSHLDQIGKGIASAGDKIGKCGEEYQQREKETTEKLQKIIGDLSAVKA